MSQNISPAMHPHPQIPSTQSIYGTVDTALAYKLDSDGAPAQLAWHGDLAGAATFRRRVTRPARQGDSTINFVKANREYYIHRMVQAVYSTTTAKDNPSFDGMAWFTLGGDDMVSPYEVEALCRVLFQAVIDRCEDGYRGMQQADRLSKRPVEKVDITGDCKTRIENVIHALLEWKSICKDVIVSDSRIADFANAPASIAQDKQKYRNNNSTKKNTTQKERRLGVAALHGAETAEELKAKGDLPPLARLGRQTKRRGRPSKKGSNSSDALPQAQSQRQSQTSSQQSDMEPQTQLAPQSQTSSASSKSRDSEKFGQGLLNQMSATQLHQFDTLSQDFFGSIPSNATSDPPRHPPAYDYPDFGEQRQPYVLQEEHLSTPQPSQSLQQQLYQQQPSGLQAHPAYSPYAVGAMQHVSQQFDG